MTSSEAGEIGAASGQVSTHLIRPMVSRCLLAMSLLAAAAVTEYWWIRSASRVFQYEAKFINLAGRQRMVIQRTGLLAGELGRAADDRSRSHRRAELSRLAHELEEAHRIMLEGNDVLRVPPPPAAVSALYFEGPDPLDARVKRFAAEARRLAAEDPSRLRPDNPHVRYLQEAALDAALLRSVETVLHELGEESHRNFLGLQAAGIAILVFTFTVLVLTGLGVFWPMVGAVRAGTQQLESANQALDRRASQLDEALAELRRHRDEQVSRLRAMVSVMEDVEEERGKLEREVQARQIVQEALEESEKRVWAILESAPTAMVMTGPKGRIVLVNTETEKLFGYRREELLQQPVELLVPERLRGQHPQYRAEFFSKPEVRRMGAGRDLFGLRKDGSEFPVEIGLNPIASEEGIYVLSAIVDITERKRVEREIQRINRELQRKNDELQQYVYTISHDLKSPLVTCKGFLGILRDDLTAGRHDESLGSIERIERATERMAALLDDLLQLSRIGTIRNEPQRVQTTELVQGIVSELSGRLEAVAATVKVQPALPAVVADRLRLAEVFENLLSNAIKYGCPAPQGTIAVGGFVANHEVRFFVRDDGPGIEPEFHRRIFGLFQRLETDGSGTGVGLAAVARIMEIHGGRAWVESAVSEGATFWIAFPEQALAPEIPLENPVNDFNHVP